MRTNAFCNHCRYNIKCYTIQREKPNQKNIFSIFHSVEKIFSFIEKFFSRKIEKKREKVENLFPREIFISQNRKKLFRFTKDETTNISNAINVTRKFLST